MILYKAWTLDTSFRLRGVFDWLLYSHKYTQNSSLHQLQMGPRDIIISGLGTPHWHPMILVYSPFKGLGFIDELLLEHEELPHVLDLAVHLVKFESRGPFWDTFTFSTFSRSPLLKLGVGWCWGGGPCYYCVSPWSKSFFYNFLGDFHSTKGSVGTGAWTWTWTRAWQ